ncbi:HXXEE domain-containing protein [Burkholderia cenocepacia]|uniref:HXXEE domain-containing protein n=1 Tax=Burkholderia cenocepacia TaxID=95486 RepID=UPI0023B986EA|nr:HXXEE domain-containing protein [Burkholderia cenocepacia]MDF0501448.1 HXXEE domain-containing protein [Burkholderia cenocepacia]
MTWSAWDYGWPYLCLGGGLVMFAVLFLTNVARSDLRVQRWHDPVWLAWLIVPMLMVHMFEEYGFDLLGRSNAFPVTMCKMLGYPPYPDCPMPMAHYALLNLGVAWIGAPIAAAFARRNLMVGLTFHGLTAFNGVTHIAGVAKGGLDSGSGLITGVLFFIPSFLWMVHVVRRSGALSTKALAVSVAGGLIAHLVLVAGLGLYRLGAYGANGVFVIDVLVVIFPFIVVWSGNKLFGPFPPRAYGAEPNKA